MFFSVLGIVIATVLVEQGKMTDVHWAEFVGVCIFGHHAQSLIQAWRGNASST